ncbi:beta-N-acetylhexosaminidase [Bifidobacterium biavatii]|uniref:beta-N-acetylhexosaminidase n=1 Tax=Bifidobacterium biavatii DSM 23969 TaxID=1437608 RepID=A0A087A4M4_9BIFI|nr:glycoside hydrolase family 20 zincin-like fold domain-containing protein [Bifidobacterium biavatii]KFI53724.1 glycosyl hydrolase [Bifidobacterium biavatii DSM 23969]
MQYSNGTQTIDFELIPQPKEVRVGTGAPVLLPVGGRVVENLPDDPACVFARQIVDDIRHSTGLSWDVARGDHWHAFIRIGTDANLASDEYRLNVTSDGITVTGGGAAGVRDGVQTLRQLIRQTAPAIPPITVSDSPAYQVRGYYLDATRGRVPTLDWLKRWADKLCLYKYNQLQLYIEHTFKFDDLSETWRGVSPLTPSDIIEFDDYCAKLGIELVPSVSTFGHHYMALRTHELRRLGEFPEQADRPYSFVERMEHHTLNITEPESLELSFKLIDSYLELFRTRKFNICGDETFDLGKGRSKPEAERVGVARMYADYVTKLCRHLSDKGREPMFWGDIAVEMPEILTMLPKNVLLLNWLYSPNITDDKVRLVAESGATQYVCPAVWCWNALLPRLDWAWNNITRLARYGLAYHAAGFLVTDWGDYGHVNDPRMAIPGMIYGAQAAWNPEAVEHIADMNRRISVLEYGDRTGKLLAALRDTSEQVGFGWDNLVRYLELDEDRRGTLNQDVLHAIWTGENVYAPLIHNSTTLGEARRNLLAWLKPSLDQVASRNANLDRALAEIGIAVAGAAGSDHASVLQPIMIAIRGQQLLNDAGVILAWLNGVAVGAADGAANGAANGTAVADDDANARADARLTARRLEEWFEDYSAVWREVSRQGELSRIADVVWRLADELRRAE